MRTSSKYLMMFHSVVSKISTFCIVLCFRSMMGGQDPKARKLLEEAEEKMKSAFTKERNADTYEKLVG